MKKITRDTRGVYIIAATPFKDDGSLDLESADRMVDFYLSHGVNGMTILGMMGEANKLTEDESRLFASHVFKRVAGTIPVVVGVSGAGIDNLRSLAQFSMDEGAAGIMVAPTPGPAVEDRIFNYFGQVCEAVGADVPICFQDFPQATGVPVSSNTILTLTRRHPQIVMLKHEDCPGLAKIEAVRNGTGTTDTPRMSILCGNGGLYLPLELQRGADGAMTGFAYPEMLVQVVARHAAGDVAGAEDMFDAYLPILRYEQQLNFGLAARKEILRRRGAIASAFVRKPGPRLSDGDHADIGHLMLRTAASVEKLAHAA
ncbi:dihydrodipicolinate synthase family protein [Mesorhizobium sp. INR15]|uniref:dihydrodipicolinate synthase family protein n=1 Tax=Mesorhizobium sp. INR15 TaxID=2654248 RepID=UPI0021561A20|nr:dihydrodipicolinate synthase family protein [Mesorhizobium sp. INR15]